MPARTVGQLKIGIYRSKSGDGVTAVLPEQRRASWGLHGFRCFDFDPEALRLDLIIYNLQG